MYGMVNQAIKEMVVEDAGQDFWQDICDKISIPDKDFVVFEQYDDEVTLNIVLKICELTGNSAHDTLVSFGKYWIKFAYKSDYRSILDTFSDSPVNLIKSLNSLHDMLELSFDALNAPSFDTIEEGQKSLTVNYYSDREMPLEFFVKGLFEGIFAHFNQKCEVKIIETLGDAKATFLLTY